MPLDPPRSAVESDSALLRNGSARPDLAELLRKHSEKGLLRFLTCGSVDDGKSTLIGRLLLESGAVYDDQLATLRRDSDRHGNTQGDLDTSLLVDGLEDERQQGITIDVAYRYFTTPKRKFIIADTPGHEQFTRNMATGASCSDLAVIVVDATKGVLNQTRRHAFIVSLLGIKHIVLAVNKMDLVDYQQSVFDQIHDDFCRLAEKLCVPDIRFVPVSALKGDNVVEPSLRTPWYEDGSLLHLLETIYVAPDRGADQLRFPVQWVNRPDASFRGFSGTIASGKLCVGAEVAAFPSHKRTRIRRIVTMDGELPEASAPAAVTVVLEDELDVTRGDMLVDPQAPPQVVRTAEATLVWMSEHPLTTGRPYWCKHTTRKTSCEIETVICAIQVNTQQETPAASLHLNQMGVCRLLFRDPLAVDPFTHNRHTGSLILVDRITHETVAAGMIRRIDATAAADHWDARPEGMGLERAVSLVTLEERAARFSQKPCTVLITGLSGSGKTTVAQELEKTLFEFGQIATLLDGQTLRFGISRDLGFSAEERSENLRRGAEFAKLVNDAGQICIAAFVAPHEAVRQRVRALVGADRLLHVHLTTPLDTCRRRDPSGRYAAAERGEIDSFPGITFAYEEPADADLTVSTEGVGTPLIVAQIMELLEARGFLEP
jgi:bifunctional enzyme CysN/CysC